MIGFIRYLISHTCDVLSSWCVYVWNFCRRKKVIRFENGLYVRVERQIAEGGFSVVYEAHDYKKGGKTRYALKRLLCFDKGMVQKCREEAGIHKMFKHPNLLSLRGIKFEKSETYIVCYMLFPLFSSSLRDEITRRNLLGGGRPKPFKAKKLLEIFGGVVDAVNEMHKRGLTHRDIKVENVLLDGKGKPVLMDFGSAGPAVTPIPTRPALLSIVDIATSNTTISYRAPELFEGGTRYGDDIPDIDAGRDVWSLGCLLFAMMYGASPFEIEFRGEAVEVVECTHLRVLGDVPKPGQRTSLAKRYEGRVLDLVHLMLTRDRSLRPTIEEINRKIDALLFIYKGTRRWRKEKVGLDELIGDV